MIFLDFHFFKFSSIHEQDETERWGWGDINVQLFSKYAFFLCLNYFQYKKGIKIRITGLASMNGCFRLFKTITPAEYYGTKFNSRTAC